MATVFGLLAVLFWGLLAVLSVYSKMVAPFQLLALCLLLASSLVYIYRFIRREKLFKKPELSSKQWLIGILGIFGFHFFYFMAIRHAPAIEVSLISYLWPLLLGVYVSPASLIIRAIIGGGLGFLGIVILIQGSSSQIFNYENIVGYLFAFSCAFIWSGYSWFLSKQKGNTEDISWVALVCGLLAFISHLIFEESNWALTNMEWISIVFLGLGPVGGAFYLWEIGMKKGNKRLLASLSFCAPILSAFALYIFGMGDFSLEIISALSLILLGAFITNSKKIS